MLQNKKLKRNATYAIAEVAEVALCASNCALPTSASFHFSNILVKSFTVFFTYVSHIRTKKIKMRMQKMHFQGHATSHFLILLHQIVHQDLVVAAMLISKEIFYNISECFPCCCFCRCHLTGEFFTSKHLSNLRPSKYPSFFLSIR